MSKAFTDKQFDKLWGEGEVTLKWFWNNVHYLTLEQLERCIELESNADKPRQTLIERAHSRYGILRRAQEAEALRRGDSNWKT